MSNIKVGDCFKLPVGISMGNAGFVDADNNELLNWAEDLAIVVDCVNSYDILVEHNKLLREALSDLIGGQHEYDLSDHGISVGRAREILSLMRGGNNE
tara:strand:+ start:76565 stop:76858 length:294 start_codon:yes stop_codon:yes gene_type:complete